MCVCVCVLHITIYIEKQLKHKQTSLIPLAFIPSFDLHGSVPQSFFLQL